MLHDLHSKKRYSEGVDLLMDYVEAFCDDLQAVQAQLPFLAHILREELQLPIDEQELAQARDMVPDESEEEEEF